MKRNEMKRIKCGHKDGWVLKDEICIGQDDVIVLVECNTIGCGVRKLVRIDISEGREVE